MVGIKTESSGPYASVSVLEQKQFGFKQPRPRKPQWNSERTRTLALSPAFCSVEVFLGCFWMKISLPGISFLTSGVWQEDGAAASQPHSPGQSHSCTSRGPMGPAWRTVRPQIVKQTEEEKIQRKKKRKENKNPSKINKPKQKFLTEKVRSSAGDALVNSPASRRGCKKHVEGRAIAPKSCFKHQQQGPVGTEEPSWGRVSSATPVRRRSALQPPFPRRHVRTIQGLGGFGFKGGKFATACCPLTAHVPLG